MRCSVCGTETSTSGTCHACDSNPAATFERRSQATPAAGDTFDVQTSIAEPDSAPTRVHPGAASAGPLTPGQAFGRYHVIRLLGAGGMGAVYQAWDDELGESVAVKVIRPQVERDPAAAQDIERRFKRELLLARQVTHKNVVRIHDLGEIGGIKYITMPYVQGRDLATVLRAEGRLPVARALALARDIAAGLQAAHEAGVVHRDLKPANVMVDEDGRAIIMDFGIARSTSGPASGTVAGAVIGTLEYMAPEQALGQVVDHRADHYAFGLIFRDMLVGPRQASRAESAVAELLHRLQQPLPPVRTIDAGLPAGVDALIVRCTAPDPAARFATTVELVAEIDALAGSPQTGTPATAVPGATGMVRPRAALGWWRAGLRPAVLGVAALLVLLAGAALVLRPWEGDASVADATRPARSVAIVPFRNAGGDASLDWLGTSIAEVLRSELSNTGGVRVLGGNRVHEILRDLRVSPAATWDTATASRVAQFGNAETIVTGEYARFGTQVRLNAVLLEIGRAASTQVTATAADDNAILAAVGELARGLHASLTIERDADVRGPALAPMRPSTTSLAALRTFTEGVESARRGDHQKALQQFEAATAQDPRFALAWARLAQAHADLGYDAQAAEASRRAVALADSLPERERYLIAATHAAILNDHQRAIEAYERLLAMAPDTEIAFALAARYEAIGAFDQAHERYAQVAAQDPNYLEALFALGRVEIRRKSPSTALDPLNRALTLAVRIDNQQAKGALLNAIGVAYKRLDKPEEALRYYRESFAIREALEDKRGMAATLSELAQVEALLGRHDDALQHYRRSLALRREIGDRSGVGNTLNDIGSLHEALGQLDRAHEFYTEALQLQQEVGNEDYQALALHNIANVLASRARYEDAVAYYTRALQLRDKLEMPTEAAEIRYNVGLVRLRQGDYDEALRQFLAAASSFRTAGDRRGEAIAVAGTSAVFARQARYGAAVDASAEALAGWRTLGEAGVWHATILATHGYALGLAGRDDDARTIFGEALTAMRDTADDRVASEVLLAHAATRLMAGDAKGAAASGAEALQHAIEAKDERLTLAGRLAAAEVAARTGRGAAIAAEVIAVRDAATRLGLAPLATEARLVLGETLLGVRAFQKARAELESALRHAERTGARGLVARAHHGLALVAAAAGQTDLSQTHAREARRALDQITAETPGGTLMTRADLRSLGEASPATEPAGHPLAGRR